LFLFTSVEIFNLVIIKKERKRKAKEKLTLAINEQTHTNKSLRKTVDKTNNNKKQKL